MSVCSGPLVLPHCAAGAQAKVKIIIIIIFILINIIIILSGGQSVGQVWVWGQARGGGHLLGLRGVAQVRNVLNHKDQGDIPYITTYNLNVSFWFCWIIIQVITGGHDTSPSSTSRTSTAGTTSCGWTTPTVNCNDILQLMRRTLEPNEEAMSRSYIIEKWESARNMYVDML